MFDDKTDEEVARLVQDGNQIAFKTLVERYERKIVRYVRRFLFIEQDAEDLTQEIFIKSYTNIKSFDVSRKFSPWIYRIAHNHTISALRKRTRQPLIFFDASTFFPHPIAPSRPDNELMQKELREIMDQCLEKIPFKYREVMILYYYENMDYRSISEILRVPVSTVGVRLKRGKERLFEQYKKETVV